MRGSLCTVTTIPVGIPAQAERRRNSWPVRDFLFCGVSVARRGACAARLTSGPVLQLRTLPPLILFLGHRHSQESKCAEVGERDRSCPSSTSGSRRSSPPCRGMNIRPVFASALRPVRGGARPCARNTPLLLLFLSPPELRIPNLTPPPSQCPRLSHSALLSSRVDIAKGSHHTFSSLFRDGNGGYSKRLPPGPGDATFRRGQHLSKALLSGRCPSGAFRLACARGEIGETVHITTMPLGRNAQLFGEVGIFP